MKRLMLLILLVTVATSIAASRASTGVCDRITIDKPTIVIKDRDAKQGRLLFGINNPDDEGHRLKAAFSPAADRAVLPDSLQDDPIWEPNGVAVPANDSRALNDDHPAMLFGLHDIKPDNVTPVVVICEDGSHKLIKATVRLPACQQDDDEFCQQTDQANDD